MKTVNKSNDLSFPASLTITTAVCLAVLACLAQPAFSEANSNRPEGKSLVVAEAATVGGDYAKKGEYPYQVFVQAAMQGPDGKLVEGTASACGGTIINPDWILTAAHCVYYVGEIKELSGQLYNAMSIGFGDVNLVNLIGAHVEKIYPHEGYDPITPRSPNDIALLQLEPNSGAEHWVALIDPPAENRLAATGTKAVVVGWGATYPVKLLEIATEALGIKDLYGPDIWSAAAGSSKLKKTEVPIFDLEECKKIGLDIKDTNICAGGEPAVGACYGDSGGPLLVPFKDNRNGYIQVGVVSRAAAPGAWCGLPKVPGIYTRVAPYIDWIVKVVRENTKE